MLQGFLTSQDTMMRNFLASQASRRDRQGNDSPDLSDSEQHGDDTRVKDHGKLISKFIKSDAFSGDMSKWMIGASS